MTSPGQTTKGEAWTTKRLLAWIGDRFRRADLESPRLLGEMLIAHVLGCERMRLYMDADRPATPIELEMLRELVQRAIDGEPVQYLTGEGWFFSLPFTVDRRVLIPRPSTETLVEHVLQHARAEPGFESPSIADVCTGSGCIAVSILKQLPGARAIATDISTDALEVALQNAQRHDVQDRLDLENGDLLTPIRDHPSAGSLHYLVSNPPYIPDSEWTDPSMVQASVRDFEPEIALRGGEDGLDLIRPIISDAPDLLREGGVLAIETAAATAKQVCALMDTQIGLIDGRVVEDFEGYPRIVIARRG
jgi:release factor glutamine methyltransferase